MAELSTQNQTVPYRLISRLSNEFHLSGVINLARLDCGDYDRAIVFLTLLRVCLPDWIEEGRLRIPRELTRFGSIKSLARSLDRPPQTIRRYVRSLVARGLCLADSRGIAIRTEGEDAERVLTYLFEMHDILLRMAEDLHRARILRARAAPSGGPLEGAITRTSIDMSLVPFAILRDTVGNWTSMLVWAMIGTANTRHIMLDPVLTLRFAVEPTPDEMRRPVSLHAVAATIDVAYATAWRHVERLRQAGLIARRDGGWLLTSRELHRAEVEAAVRDHAGYYLRRLDQLIAEGLDLTRLSELYRAGRPELVAIGRYELADAG